MNSKRAILERKRLANGGDEKNPAKRPPAIRGDVCDVFHDADAATHPYETQGLLHFSFRRGGTDNLRCATGVLASEFRSRALASTPVAHQRFGKVGPLGLEPRTKGLCLPLRLSPPLSSSWSGLYLRVTRLPSSLYAFRPRRLGSGLAWLVRAVAFPEFGRFYGSPRRAASRRRTPPQPV